MSVVNFTPVYILAEDKQSIEVGVKKTKTFIEKFFFWIPMVQIVVICFLAYKYLFHELVFIFTKYIVPVKSGTVSVHYSEMNNVLQKGKLNCEGDFLTWSLNGSSGRVKFNNTNDVQITNCLSFIKNQLNGGS